MTSGSSVWSSHVVKGLTEGPVAVFGFSVDGSTPVASASCNSTIPRLEKLTFPVVLGGAVAHGYSIDSRRPWYMLAVPLSALRTFSFIGSGMWCFIFDGKKANPDAGVKVKLLCRVGVVVVAAWWRSAVPTTS